jgi:hypothetical protein
VQEAQRLAGSVDDAHRAELGHDLAHRPAGRVHVTNEGGEALLIFIDHYAHAGFGGARRTGRPQ